MVMKDPLLSGVWLVTRENQCGYQDVFLQMYAIVGNEVVYLANYSNFCIKYSIWNLTLVVDTIYN